MKKILSLLTVAIVLLAASCNQNKEAKFETTESGIEYKIVETKEDAQKANYGDFLVMSLDYYWQDSLLFKSSRDAMEDLQVPYYESQYLGSFSEALGLAKIGDSIIFRLDANKFFQNEVGMPAPDFIAEGDKLEFRIRVKSMKTQAEIEKEVAEMQQAKMEEEKMLLADYLANNQIEAEPTESGLYYIEIEKGNGKKAQVGDTVSMHYTGTLINGMKFDSSVDRDEPFDFQLGVGQVIPGWDEGVAMMNVGSKAKLIIPSSLAYGPNGAGGVIPPFSTLIFEVELLEIKK